MRYTQPQNGQAPATGQWLGAGLNSFYALSGNTFVDIFRNRAYPAITGAPLAKTTQGQFTGVVFSGSQGLTLPAGGLSAGTQFSKFALISLSNNSSSGTISCTAGSNGAQLRVNSGSLELLYSAAAVVLSVPHGIAVNKLACVGVTCDGTTARLFVNGREIGSVACAINFTNFSIEQTIGVRAGNVELFQGSMFAHADISRAVAPATARAITQNIWQILASPQRRLLVDVTASGGGTSYSYTASGGLVLSGAIATVRGRVKVASGGILTGGVATVARGTTRSTTGGVQLGGAATSTRRRSIAATGGLALSGASSIARRAARTAVGGIQFAGAAAVSFGSAVQTRIVTPTGGMILAGAAAIRRSIRKFATGGLTFGGAATVAQSGTDLYPARVFVSTVMQFVPLNASVPASETSVAASGGMSAMAYESSIMTNTPFNAHATMSNAALNLTANLL